MTTKQSAGNIVSSLERRSPELYDAVARIIMLDLAEDYNTDVRNVSRGEALPTIPTADEYRDEAISKLHALCEEFEKQVEQALRTMKISISGSVVAKTDIQVEIES